MVNNEDLHEMTPFQRQVLRDLRAVSLWTLLTFLAVVFAPAMLVILSLLGY